MTLQLLHPEFPYIWWKFDFLFYQCAVKLLTNFETASTVLLILIVRCSPASTPAALKMCQNLLVLLHVAFDITFYRITGGFLCAFSESKASLWRGLWVTIRMCKSNFIEASKNFDFNCSNNKASNKFENHHWIYRKYLLSNIDPQKMYSSDDPILKPLQEYLPWTGGGGGGGDGGPVGEAHAELSRVVCTAVCSSHWQDLPSPDDYKCSCFRPLS